VLRLRVALLASLTATGLVVASCDDGPKTGSPGLEPPRPVMPGGTTDPGQGGSGGGDGSGGRTGSTPGSSSGTGGTNTSTPPPVGTGGSMSGTPSEDPDLDGGSAPVEDTGMFAGFWVVDQPSHALYEATLYELVADGTVNVGPTELLGAEPWPDFVTGTVANAAGSARCDLAGPWRSSAPRVLQLESTCTDGTPRTVTLTFPNLDPAVGIMPASIEVDGQSGWTHPGFPWAWRKCGSAPCMPF
jgi:hypothetical protein